jgi:hypothetical protein
MYARIGRWEGDKEALDAMLSGIKERSDEGPPEGVPSKSLKLFRSLDGGTTVVIAFFETEDDLRKGDETLNSMTPPGDVGDSVRRVSVDLAEVALELEA